MPRDSILITGANGFIGSHLVREFQPDYTVVGLSTGSVNHPGGADIYYQMSLPHADIEQIFARHRPRFCIHCAGPASVGHSVNHPAVDFHVGPVTLFQIADTIRKQELDCTIVFPSSAAVYGNPQRLPVAEEHPSAPISPYGFHKKIGEDILIEFQTLYGVPYLVLRIFSCYGAGLRKQLLWDVCGKVRQGELRLFGTGSETRDFIHVHDLAAAVKRVMCSGVRNRVFNLGNGEQVSIADMVEEVRKAFGASCPPAGFSGEVRPGDPRNWEADISELRNLGYSPSISLQQGVQGYVDWFRSVTDVAS